MVYRNGNPFIIEVREPFQFFVSAVGYLYKCAGYAGNLSRSILSNIFRVSRKMENKSPYFMMIGFGAFAVLFGRNIDLFADLLFKLFKQTGERTGADVNLLILCVVLAFLPFAPFVLLKLKPVALITLFTALLPLFSRIRALYGIFAYTDFVGNPYYISGAALITPFLFLYLFCRYPVRLLEIWTSLPSKGFCALVLSTFIVQLVFFDILSALRITYVIIGVHLLLYSITISYIRTEDDVYRTLICVVVAVVFSGILALLTTSQGPIPLFDNTYYTRLDSNTLGLNNYYAALLSSTLCFLPYFYFEFTGFKRLAVLLTFLFIFKLLLLTGARGALVGLLPLLSYIIIFKKRPGLRFWLPCSIIIGLVLFSGQIDLYLNMRGWLVGGSFLQVASVAERLDWSIDVIRDLLRWPHFIFGYGMGTFENWTLSSRSLMPIQGIHQGLLNIWVIGGLIGLIGFLVWIVGTLTAGISSFLRAQDGKGRMLILSIVNCISSWMICFVTTGGWYLSGQVELYAILTIEMGLLAVLVRISEMQIATHNNVFSASEGRIVCAKPN